MRALLYGLMLIMADSPTLPDKIKVAPPPANVSLSGIYKISGVDGKPYGGMARVYDQGAIVVFTWVVGQDTIHGIGLRTGNSIGISWSTKDGKRGQTVYEIKPGKLKGMWTTVDEKNRKVERPNVEELQFLTRLETDDVEE